MVKAVPTIAFDEAVKLYAEFLHETAENMGMSASDFAALSFTDLAIAYHPGIETIICETHGCYHVVDEITAASLCGAAHEFPAAAHVVTEICARNVFAGQPLPTHLRFFASQIIRGTAPIKKTTGPKQPINFALRWVLYEGARYLADAYNFPLNHFSDSEGGHSACEAMSDVAERFDFDESANAIRDWGSKAKYKNFRNLCHALTNYIKDLELKRLGVLKREPVLGPFVELGRMRRNGGSAKDGAP